MIKQLNYQFRERCIGQDNPYLKKQKYQLSIHGSNYSQVFKILAQYQNPQKNIIKHIQLEIDKVQNFRQQSQDNRSKFYQYCEAINFKYHQTAHIRLIIKHQLLQNKEMNIIVQVFNNMPKLQQIELISETQPIQDDYPSWVHFLNKLDTIKKLKTRAKIVTKINQQISKPLLQTLQETIPRYGYQSSFNGQIKKFIGESHKIKEWHCEYLRINNQKSPKIMKYISQIEFKQLLKLSLERDRIISIQTLSRLQAQKLTFISLQRNNIVNIQPLKKMQTSKIQQLNISDNFIFQYRQLANMNLKIVNTMWVVQRKKTANIYQWICKLETNLKNITIDSKQLPRKVRANILCGIMFKYDRNMKQINIIKINQINLT